MHTTRRPAHADPALAHRISAAVTDNTSKRLMKTSLVTPGQHHRACLVTLSPVPQADDIAAAADERRGCVA
jgi:hypothetical protein